MTTEEYNLTKAEKDFILKAIINCNLFYDFDLNKKEFNESYGITKSHLLLVINELRSKLAGEALIE